DAEPRADHATQVDFTGGGPVADHVARDDLLVGGEVGLRVGGDRDPAAGQALAHVVVGVTGQPQGDPAGQEGPERLAPGTAERDVDGVVGQAFGAPPLGDLVAEHGADRAVDVPHRQVQPDRAGVLQRALGQLDQRVVQGPVDAV